jgi:hypothetical protein
MTGHVYISRHTNIRLDITCVGQATELGVASGNVEVKEEEVKKEEAADAGNAKEAGDVGNAADSPVPSAKRACKQEEEEGDWVPPKKIGRGPGTLDKYSDITENYMKVSEWQVKTADEYLNPLF